MLVMGPWNHGGFARGTGDHLGSVTFGSNTSAYYREHIEFPFFLYHLKNRGDGKFPQAWLFQTGMNQWMKLDQWPPKQAHSATMYLSAKGKLSATQPAAQTADEYLADPNRPVPSFNAITVAVPNDYMVSDQRYAATRPDVLVYKTEPLDHDVTITGPISIDLKVSTTGTDSDFDVKLIDVYPGDYPDLLNPPAAAAAGGPPAAGPVYTTMGGYQQLIRGEPFRGKYRHSFEKPVPFDPGKPDRIQFKLPDVMHTFRAGHRIMIQVQSSWFPLNDRNPQKFMDISKARPEDFQKATQHVYIGGVDGSRIVFAVVE
jgi:putative CocE/NonD family hydrolase